MKNFKLSAIKILIVFAVIAPCLTPLTVLAEDLPEGVKQVWTSVEGNIIYYVKKGDKVKKDDPLFFVVTTDNNPALFFEYQHKINYYKKLYNRRMKLIKTHAVSREDYDNAFQNYINARDEFVSYICKVKSGFYTAPFDCEIVELLYLQHSGIGDGNPAINIKCTDKNYQFIPPKPDEKFVDIIEKAGKYIKEKIDEFNANDLTL